MLLSFYKSFRDPHSAFDIASKQYSFMTSVQCILFPMLAPLFFFLLFNTPEEFLIKNRLGGWQL